MYLLAQWISPSLIKALCWMLLHSLWQGLLAAVLAGIIVVATRRAGARLRYRLLTLLFLACICCFAGSFYRGFTQAVAADATAAGAAPAGSMVNDALLYGKAFTDYFNRHASLVVLVWALVFIARLVKLLADLYALHRLRYYKTSAPGDEWLQRLSALSKGMGIRRPVALLQSALVQVPVTLGFFKPLILVPIGLLNQLPPEQVETILLHELAHIRRSDYLVNLLQSAVETVFFFNPGIRWLSSIIREEREACCDDMVLLRIPEKKTYVEALVGFQEQLAAQPAAVALTGNRQHLLHRIKRIIYQDNTTLSFMEKLLLGAGLLMTGLAMVAFTHTATLPVRQTVPVSGSLAIATRIPAAYDTVPARSNTDTAAVRVEIKVREEAKVREEEKAREQMNRALEAKQAAEADYKKALEAKRQAEEAVKQAPDQQQVQKIRQAQQLLQEKMRAEQLHQRRAAGTDKLDAEQRQLLQEKMLAEQAQANTITAKLRLEQSKQMAADAKRMETEARLLKEQSQRLTEEAKKLAEQAQKQ